MKIKKINKKLLNTAIITFVTISIWVGIEIFLTTKKYEIPKVLQEQKKPINPNLNKKVIEKLKNKNHLEEEDLQEITKFVNAGELSVEGLQASTSTGSGEQKVRTGEQFFQVQESTQAGELETEKQSTSSGELRE